MKEIVIYYSFSGKTQYIAQKISKKRNCDIFEIELVKPYTKKTVYVRGGFETKTGTNPELKNTIDLSSYDTIWLGTPVWAWTYSAVINSFIDNNNLKNKNIIFFCSHLGDKGKTFEKISKKLSSSNLIAVKDFLGKNIESRDDDITAWIDSFSN